MRAVTGVVPLEGRGGLPFAELHREAMFLHSVRTLLGVERGGAGIVVTVDPGQRSRAERHLVRHRLRVEVQDWQTWCGRDQRARDLVLLDPLCPLVPASFVKRVLDRPLVEEESGVAGYRPITDTIKTVVDHQIVTTINRDEFVIITSPVLIPARLHSGEPPPVADFGELLTWLRARGSVSLVKAPSMARRVDDESAVVLLESVDELARSLHEG